MKERKINESLKPFARELRKNMTKEERHLWYDFLRTHPARFTRQRILGKYIADFYSAKAKLIIELDGSQHGEENNRIKDEERTSYLEQFGAIVVRIPNYEIHRNFKAVCLYINRIASERMIDN